MKAIAKRIRSFLQSEDGPTATEYGIMLALVIVVAIAAISSLGTKVSGVFSAIDGSLVAPGGS